MRNALTYQTIKHNSQKTAQGTNVENNQKELKEHSTQGTNVPNNLTQKKKELKKQCAKH